MNSIPTLETERLTLRGATINDWPAYRDMMQSNRSLGMGGPFCEREAWGMFCHDVGQWTLFGHGALMIDVRGTGQCVGQVGVNSGPLFAEHELGWYLYEGFEGHGYAFEAAIAMRNWAFHHLELSSLVSYTDRDNHASRQLATRLGATLDPDAPRPAADDLVYRHWKP